MRNKSFRIQILIIELIRNHLKWQHEKYNYLYFIYSLMNTYYSQLTSGIMIVWNKKCLLNYCKNKSLLFIQPSTLLIQYKKKYYKTTNRIQSSGAKKIIMTRRRVITGTKRWEFVFKLFSFHFSGRRRHAQPSNFFLSFGHY